MLPRIRNETLKKECIWVRIRGAFLAKKGAPKLSFHREGGQSPPFAPLNPPLGAVSFPTIISYGASEQIFSNQFSFPPAMSYNKFCIVPNFIKINIIISSFLETNTCIHNQGACTAFGWSF